MGYEAKGVIVATYGPDADAPYSLPRTVKVPLVASDAAGGLFSWQNPHDLTVLVTRVILVVTTASTGACTGDFGATATTATTLSDTLLDGVALNTLGIKDNTRDYGTNGKPGALVASAKWVTGSVASGASAGLVGYAYITYTVVR